ncbi:trypsin-like peptidase domain-containing protein [Streptomyces sp. NPDC006622]|uniref:S1C family serine protease n=1 Tax=Streptomyces sp. NPDC006622 TaxID=3155459 RepID=UPI0033AD44D3
MNEGKPTESPAGRVSGDEPSMPAGGEVPDGNPAGRAGAERPSGPARDAVAQGDFELARPQVAVGPGAPVAGPSQLSSGEAVEPADTALRPLAGDETQSPPSADPASQVPAVTDRPKPLHDPDPYSTPPYGEPGPWAPAPPVQHPAASPTSATAASGATVPTPGVADVRGTGIPEAPPLPPGVPAAPVFGVAPPAVGMPVPGAVAYGVPSPVPGAVAAESDGPPVPGAAAPETPPLSPPLATGVPVGPVFGVVPPAVGVSAPGALAPEAPPLPPPLAIGVPVESALEVPPPAVGTSVPGVVAPETLLLPLPLVTGVPVAPALGVAPPVAGMSAPGAVAPETPPLATGVPVEPALEVPPPAAGMPIPDAVAPETPSPASGVPGAAAFGTPPPAPGAPLAPVPDQAAASHGAPLAPVPDQSTASHSTPFPSPVTPADSSSQAPADPWRRYDPWAAAPLGAGPLQQSGGAVLSVEQRRRRRRRGLVGGALLVALVSGGVGGGVGGYLERNGGVAAVELPQAPVVPGGRDADSVAGIAARALPGVVTLHVSGSAEAGTGTGFVLDTRGHILTNSHVVEPAGSGGEISVTFNGGQTAEAEVVGKDSGYDLAVVRVTGVRGLEPLPLGNSDNVRVGDPVVAIGAPFDLAGTVTSGIISARERPITAGGGSGDGSDVSYVDALQTDAPINPGNSGGPLLDTQGHVIGINSAIRSAADGSDSDGGRAGSIGLGFAIPVNQGKRVAEELINTGRATHPVIGVTLDMDYAGDGARVGTENGGGSDPVTAGGPGDRAGIRPGDVITAVDGRRVHSGEELIVRTRAHRPGDRLELTVERDGKERALSLVLGSSDSG